MEVKTDHNFDLTSIGRIDQAVRFENESKSNITSIDNTSPADHV